MKILLSSSDSRYLPISNITFPRMEAWAARHGWKFLPVDWEFIKPPKIFWKVKSINYHLAHGAQVLWIDADIKILDLNDAMTPFFSGEGFTFSEDKYGICAGMFYSSGNQALNIVRAVSAIHDCKPPFRKFEQDAFKLLLPALKVEYRTIPESLVSNPETGSIGSFAHHHWANGAADKNEVAKILEPL